MGEAFSLRNGWMQALAGFLARNGKLPATPPARGQKSREPSLGGDVVVLCSALAIEAELHSAERDVWLPVVRAGRPVFTLPNRRARGLPNRIARGRGQASARCVKCTGREDSRIEPRALRRAECSSRTEPVHSPSVDDSVLRRCKPCPVAHKSSAAGCSRWCRGRTRSHRISRREA